MNLPYRLLLYVSFAIVFPLVFLAASCEATKEPNCDSYKAIIDERDSVINEAALLSRELYDSMRYWKEQALGFKSVTAINHLTIERLNAVNADLAFDLRAREEHESDMIAEYKIRLDTAVAQRERFRKKLIACRCTKP